MAKGGAPLGPRNVEPSICCDMIPGRKRTPNYGGSARLRFSLRLNKTKIRQRGSRHLGIKCSQMRSDGSQLPQITPAEREYTTAR